MRRLQKEMDRLFDNTLASHPPAALPSSETAEKSAVATTDKGAESVVPFFANWKPKVDVSENDTSIIVHAELPGLKKEEINVEFADGVLTLSGERKFEKKEENEKYHRIERSYGKFSRSLRLPEGVDPKDMQASYNNGVVELTIKKPPVPEEKKPVKLAVN